MVTVVIETDGLPARTLRIERFPCRIGRARNTEIVLPGWRVGRVHAELHRVGRGLKLVDAGTLSGTWVNGVRVAEYSPLTDVDEVLICGHRLRVIPGEAANAAVTAELDAAARAPRHAQEALAGEREPAARQTPRDGRDGASAEQGFGHPPACAPRPVSATHPETTRHVTDTEALEWRRVLHRRLLQTIDLRRKDIRQLSADQLRAETKLVLDELIADEPGLPRRLAAGTIVDEVLDEAIGLGPLERLLQDSDVTEIMVNGPDSIYVERDGRLARTSLAFSGEAAVRAVIDRIVAPVGRRIDENSPMVDARLPDGSRVNAVVPPLAVRGAALTIRRFNRQVFAPTDLLRLGSASATMIEFLRLCVGHRRNIVISGGTGSGKTTLLNVLSNLVPEGERIVTIEDAAELRLDHEHLVCLEARPPNAEGRGTVAIRDLVRNALRMRPDRIVVGECRGGEALDMLQAMNTGHDGSLTTIHANSPRDVIARLETMVLMAGMDLPVAAIRDQIASAVQIVVQQARGADGRRRIVEIAEITGVEGARVQMQTLFRFERGRFLAFGGVPVFYEELRASGEPIDLHWTEGETS